MIYQLQSEGYVEAAASKAFSLVAATVLNDFLAQRQTQSENQVIRAVRSWISR